MPAPARTASRDRAAPARTASRDRAVPAPSRARALPLPVPVVPALLLTLLLSLLVQLDAPRAHGREGSTDPVVAALTEAARPLAGTEPYGDLRDLRPLGRAVGDAVIVGVGEATHGSHDFFTFQHRVFRHLAREKGFTSFAREAGWNAGLRIDQWVLTGEGDIRQIMREVLQSEDRLWNNQEYLDLFRWMREYNTRHDRKVRFVGDDIVPVEPELYDRVLDYVARHHPDRYRRFSELYRDHPAGSVLEATREFKSRPQQQRLDLARRARQAHALLRSLPPGPDRREFRLTVQHARVIAQNTRFYSFDTDDEEQLVQQDLYRDEQMAANLTWWHRFTGDRILLAAHDGHVALVSNSPEYPRPQGAFLRDRFGGGYVSLRTSFGRGSFVAYGPENTLRTFTVGPPAPGTNEHTLDRVPFRDYLLDLRTVPEPARRWLDVPRPTREIGTVWPVPLAPTALRPSSDLLVHLHRVDAARLLPE
ncbi:erythromycin esterase family protein [Streptomyces sp. NPDC006624]|uniref:erythromycin esterase family protein n=1 Tax=Streptomyces sp. NPDC006624 TaxID=3154892 RepID=UPI0033A3B291